MAGALYISYHTRARAHINMLALGGAASSRLAVAAHAAHLSLALDVLARRTV